MDLKIATLNIRGVKKKENFIVNFIQRHRLDLILLQETYLSNKLEENTFLNDVGLKEAGFNPGDTRSRGVCTLICSDRVTPTSHHGDQNGRTLYTNFTFQKKEYTIINTYAPVMKTGNFHSRLEYFRDTFQYIQNFITQPNREIIWAGDFNNDEEDTDPSTNLIHEHIRYLELQSTVPFLTENSERHTYVHRGHKQHTMKILDRVYVPNHYNSITLTHIDTTTHTDHFAAIIQINPPAQQSKRKAAHWKLNSTILENKDFNAFTKALINSSIEIIESQKDDTQAVWGSFKLAIKRKALEISIIENKERKIKTKLLTDTLKEELEYSNTLKIREELDKINAYRNNGARIRTKLEPAGGDEITSHYLLREENIQKKKAITEIEMENQTKTSDPKEIVETFERYYTRLFKNDSPIDPEVQDIYIEECKVLQEEKKIEMDKELSQTEISNAIKSLNKEKSPGPDGLSNEFYIHFNSELTPLLFKLYHSQFQNNSVHSEFLESYITLIPKGTEGLILTKNYRPISLLNSDYKIISKILTSRLIPHMSELAHVDQQCSVKGRKIHNHLHQIRDTIYYTNDLNIPMKILSIDQEKAFDRVNHQFLFKVLDRCNLGNFFTKWIHILYSKPTSSVNINNSLTKKIKLERSVRQGCSLSPLLYTLVIETLISKIRKDINIKGIRMPGGSFTKVKAYADDTIFFTPNNRTVDNIINTFNEYALASGSKININKTVLFTNNGINDPHPNIIETKEIKIYGLTFDNSPNGTPFTTWKNLESKIDNIIKSYSFKHTTIFGRNYIINTMILSQFIYTCTIFSPPKRLLSRINVKIRAFLFKGTYSRISNHNLSRNLNEGGVKFQPIDIKILSLRAKYIKQVLENRAKHPIYEYYLGLQMIKLGPLLTNTPHSHKKITTQFYKEVIKIIQKHPESIQKEKNMETLLGKRDEPLYNVMKHAYRYAIIDTNQIFKNLHSTKCSNRTKEISYRFFFNMTPLGPANGKCHLCSKNINEVHLFTECIKFQKVREDLEKALKHILSINYIDITKTILTNLIDPNQKQPVIAYTLLAEYRRTVWGIYHKTRYKGETFTTNEIFQIWQHWRNAAIQNQ